MRCRVWVIVGAVVLGFLSAGEARAQEEIKPEQLRKMYDDAIANLKAAQDRKNQLAEENEKLKADIARLQGEVNELHIRTRSLEGDAARFAARTYDLRLHLAAWEQFIQRHPSLRIKWELFLQSPVRVEPVPGADIFSPATSRSADTQPATTRP